MKYLLSFPIMCAGVALPLVVAAADKVDSQLSGSVWLWTGVVIGFITSGAVYRNAHKIGGGVLQSVYNYFATGMLLVVFGFLAVVLPPWADAFIIGRTHDLLFIIGFLLMAYGAQRMLAASGLK